MEEHGNQTKNRLNLCVVDTLYFQERFKLKFKSSIDKNYNISPVKKL